LRTCFSGLAARTPSPWVVSPPPYASIRQHPCLISSLRRFSNLRIAAGLIGIAEAPVGHRRRPASSLIQAAIHRAAEVGSHQPSCVTAASGIVELTIHSKIVPTRGKRVSETMRTRTGFQSDPQSSCETHRRRSLSTGAIDQDNSSSRRAAVASRPPGSPSVPPCTRLLSVVRGEHESIAPALPLSTNSLQNDAKFIVSSNLPAEFQPAPKSAEQFAETDW